VAAGKSRIQAAKDAGYATSTAEKKSYTFLQRPLVKSALTEAMVRIGMTHEMMVQPLKDALTATRSYVDPKSGLLVETQVPDHKMRLEASRDAVAIFGGIPKVGESTPSAHGLNLFISVASAQPPRGPEPKPVNPAPINPGKSPGPTSPPKPAASKISLAVQIQPATGSVQGAKKGNGHTE
jgi:hypothetical protein